MPTATLTIPERYCGPSQTGNGGYVAGLLAGYFPGATTVRLFKGVPLKVEMRLEAANDKVRLLHDSTLIAEAKPGVCDVTPPVPPSYAEAVEASKSFVGFKRHAFPRCFVCGPEREEGDGLRIFPGALERWQFVAAPWVPDRSLAGDAGEVRPEFISAPLECIGGFAWYPNFVVLGELTVRIDGALRSGEKCVVVGWQIGVDGRKYSAGTAVYSEAGQAVAVGHATWIEISRDAFIALSRTGKSGS